VRACFELWSAVAIGFALLAGSLRAQFAYVASADGNISAYRIGEEGTLTPVAGSPFPAGNDPVSIVAAPLSKFVYVANVISSNISAYGIGKKGILTPVPGSTFAAGILPRAQTSFCGGWLLGPVPLPAKLGRQQRPGLSYRYRRGFDARRRVAFPRRTHSPFHSDHRDNARGGRRELKTRGTSATDTFRIIAEQQSFSLDYIAVVRTRT
jgi:hypothetical protein